MVGLHLAFINDPELIGANEMSLSHPKRSLKLPKPFKGATTSSSTRQDSAGGRLKPLVLVILDGWGCNSTRAHNAIASANLPHWQYWLHHYPHSQLNASGLAVGLPEGQMGNSEVGHMHIGAGRVIYQDLTRINASIDAGDFNHHPVLLELISRLKKSNKTLHVMGLLSPGGVHSHEDHLFAFLKCCQEQSFQRVVLHLFLDGRDVPPQSAMDSLHRLAQLLQHMPEIRIASIAGRYFAMDRDNRWERILPVYRLLTEGESAYHFDSAEQAIASFYDDNTFDEFIPPTRIGQPIPIQSGDAVFFFNFRSDRARQLTEVFIEPHFDHFPRLAPPQLSQFVTMTHYAEHLPTTPVFLPTSLQHMLGEVLAEAGLKQLRIAETEKYAHVTFFFNGGREAPFVGEDRILVPSPKVATYDLLPQMSAVEVTSCLVDAIKQDLYDVIICNYANADMVGHSGDFAAAVSAVECLDTCLEKVWQVVTEQGGAMLITADHGNAEIMFDEKTMQPHTAHTNQPVPFVFLGSNWHCDAKTGSLIDIAPTMLTLLGIQPPSEMTGHSLLQEDHVSN